MQDEALVGELPRWDSITAAPSSRASSRSLPARVEPEVVPVLDTDYDDDEHDDEDDEDDEIEHNYTWLHYLILVAVAVVLGLIIWKVGLEGRVTTATASSISDAGITLQSEHTPLDLYL